VGIRKICVFTGTRAEYGLLKPLMDEIKKDKELELQIMASGMHLSPEFGLTYKEIEKDGFKIDEKVEILLSADTPTAINKSIGLGIIGFADALNRLKPDISIVLGDRFEALAFAITNYIMKIPIAHLYGGEATFGSIDEGIRHAITKLSYLHFTSTETYRNRIIQLGEHPLRVFNVGALGIDNIIKMKLLSREELEKKIGRKLKKYNYLITFHPETFEKEQTTTHLQQLLKVLDEEKDCLLIFTKANADNEGRSINKILEEFVSKNKDKALLFTNMGQLFYLSTMKHADAVIGNSSSGIIEAPSLKTPTINIGNRQKGRIKAESIIDCKPEYKDIKKALEIIKSKKFKEKIKKIKSPFGDGKAAEKILKVLKNFNLSDVKKEFFDLPIHTHWSDG